MQNKSPASHVSAKLSCGPQKKTKSRNGCQRCKLKRLKCGEEKPSCQNCHGRGIPCPGYKKSLKWSTKYEVFKPDQVDLSHDIVTFDNVSTEDTGLTAEITLLASTIEEERAYPSPESETQSKSTVSPKRRGRRKQDSNAQEAAAKNVREPAATLEDRPLEVLDSQMDPAIDLDVDEILDLPSQLTEQDGLIEVTEPDPNPVENAFDIDLSEIEERPRENGLRLSRQTQTRHLLQTYYRLGLGSPTLGLADDPSYLVEYYFFNVCNLYSSFDSDLNPFRKAVKEVWDTTPSIFYAIQSMSAAQLANKSADWEMKGVDLQKKAYCKLNQELELAKNSSAGGSTTMLALLLLGLSTAWHKTDDLGECHLEAARNLIIPKLLETTTVESDESSDDNQFYEESLIYWEMLLAFVAPSNAPLSRPHNRPLLDFKAPGGKITPHPWTGVAPHIQMLFAEVGRLIKQERRPISPDTALALDAMKRSQYEAEMLDMNDLLTFSLDELDQTIPFPDILSPPMNTNSLDLAKELEEQLLAVEVPSEDEIADINDANTSKQDFIAVAEAYRYAGLLEIYRVFPSLLHTRLGTSQAQWSNRFSFVPSAASRSTYQSDSDAINFLNSLALHILTLLSNVPPDSGTFCIQPILLVTAASELRRIASLDFFSRDLHAADVEIVKARQFVETRLHMYAKRLPAKPLMRMLDIVKEVWRRTDGGCFFGEDVFWVDVMIEKGWQTVMG